MDNDSVVEQIVRSLSFEVEAIPQDNIIHLTTTTKSAPLNIKIRVRKKEEGFQHGVLSLPKPDRPDSVPERVRLASSDQTIMSFNVVMEADFQKPVKKPRKNILGIFKPSMCLGTEPDEDDYAYMPGNSYIPNINKESTSKSEGALTKFTLSKDVDNDDIPTKIPKRNKDIFGKCKPGGCLDPPFGEDIQPYVPAKVDDHTKPYENVIIRQTDGPTVENKARTSSIFGNKLFNWKRKKTNEETLDDNVISKETKAESVIDLYQAGSLQTSATYSNSIMTYPPTLNSSEHLRTQEEKQRESRIYSVSSKNSFNVHSGSYFLMPRKPKNVLDKNNIVKVADNTDLKVDRILRTSVDENNITQQQDLEDDKTKQDIETKNSPTMEVNITKRDSLNPLSSKNYKDLNHDKTSVDRYNITKQGLEDNKSKHALETKDSPITDVNIKENDSISSSEPENNKEFNHSKTSVDLNNVTNQQDQKNDETKLALRTKHLPTTDVDIIERDLMIPMELKNNPDSTDDPVTTFNSLLTQIDPNEPKNISTQKQDELIVPNLNCMYDSVIEKQISVDGNMVDAMKHYESKEEENVDVEIVKTISGDEISLITTVADHKKSAPAKEPSFDNQHLTGTEIGTIQQNQVLNENKSADKSGVIIDAMHDIYVDITGEFEENPETKHTITLNIKKKTSAECVIEEGFMTIPTPIKRDTSLEIINALTSDIKFNTENELNKQDNIMFDPMNNNIDALDEENREESLSQSETQTLLSENKLNELIQTQHETVTQNEMKIVNSQTAEIGPLDNIDDQNVSLADNNPATLEKEYEIESVTSQNLEGILFIRQSSTTSVVAEFAINSNFYNTKTSEEEKTAAEEAFANKDTESNIISNDNDTNLQRDGIYEFNKIAEKTEFMNNEIEDNKLQQQPRKTSQENTSITTDATANHNIIIADGKNMMFDKEKKVHKSKQNNNSDLKSEFNLDSQPDNQRIETVSEINSFERPISNEHGSSPTKTSEITAKNKVRPILLNIAIQSYVDNDNQVIVKSFDGTIVPQRYPQDSLKVTKRYMENDDIIQIPIGAENDLYIQLKSNKQVLSSVMEGNNAEKDTTNKWDGNKYESELDNIKRNVCISEDIRKTLETVYEKELLPLWNTISELRENMEMLTMHYTVLKGHMCVKKARYTKIPLIRKCGCMKK